MEFKATHQNRAVTEARDQLHQIRNEHRALAAQQQKIPQLEQEIVAAKHSLEELKAIEWAMEALEYQHTITALSSDKAALPQALASLSGQEIKQIEALEHQQKKAEDELVGIEKSIQTLGVELEATGMAEAIPDPALTQTVSKHLETIRSIDQTLLLEQKQLSQWQAQCKQALERLGVDSSIELQSLPKLSVSDIDQAQTLARKIDRAHQMANQTSPQSGSAQTNGARWSAPVLVILSGLAVAGLAMDLSVLAMASLAGITALSLWHLIASKKTPSQPRSETNAETLASLEAQARDLADQLGFQPALLSENASLVFGDAHRQYQAAADGLNSSEQAIAYNQNRLIETQRALGQSLGEFSADVAHAVLEAKNTSSLQAQLENWLHNAEIAHAASKEIRQLKQAQKALLDDLKDKEASLGAIYKEANLPVGAKDTLNGYLSKRNQWQEIEGKITATQTLLNDRLDRLDAFPRIMHWVEANDEASLKAALKEHQSAGEQLEQRQEELIRLQQAIEIESTGDRLSHASAELDQAIDELNTKRTQALEAKAGLFWLDAINEQTREDQGDRTFDQARDLFFSFTHHQWVLELEDTFVARRTHDQAPIPLGQLSTGTRMQLLLAVRMARVLKAEANHHALPLFIDEALTTSDPERAAAVIANIQTLAIEQDRQIFYLAASDYELQLWHHLTNEHPTHIRLSTLSENSAADPKPRLEFQSSKEIPSPRGQSLTEYANTLAIKHLSRFDPVDDLPLFYILADDLDWLHELMSIWRLTTLGPFERWLQTTQAKAQIEEPKRQTLKLRCLVVRRWWSAWHEGQAKPITEGLLHQALEGGGLTDTSLPGVIAAAHRVGFDGGQLLSYLKEHRIEMTNSHRRISSRQLKLLQEFLETHGHLPIGSPLNVQQRRQRAFERLPSDISSSELESLGALIDRLETGAG